MSDTSPPSNLEAERAVIGSMLLASDVIDDVTPIVDADDFVDEAYQCLFRAIAAMHNEGKTPDAVKLHALFKKTGDDKKYNTSHALYECGTATPHAMSAVHYARFVAEESQFRKLLQAAGETIEDVRDRGNEDASFYVERAERRVMAIAERQTTNVKPIRDVMTEAMERLRNRREGGDGLSTGFPDLDHVFNLRAGELVIVAARPSMGKTALAVNIVARVCERTTEAVLLCSLEMGEFEIAERMLSSESKVSLSKMRDGMVNPDERNAIIEASAVIAPWNLEIDDSPTRTVLAIAATARRIKRRHGLALVVVDYLQLLTPDDTRAVRQEQVASVSRRLKWLAREMKCPVIVLCQLNRQAEAEHDHRPRLRHLRESGAIEQDADVVAFVHRPSYYAKAGTPESNSNEAKIFVDKNRNGPTGEVTLLWFPKHQRFESSAQQRAEQMDSYSSDLAEWSK